MSNRNIKEFKHVGEILELDNKELIQYKKDLGREAVKIKKLIKEFGECWSIVKDELYNRETSIQYCLNKLEEKRLEASSDNDWNLLNLH
jgi:hypothetical protein